MHETFIDLMTMYLYGTNVNQGNTLLPLFYDEMKTIEYGGLHLI